MFCTPIQHGILNHIRTEGFYVQNPDEPQDEAALKDLVSQGVVLFNSPFGVFELSETLVK